MIWLSLLIIVAILAVVYFAFPAARTVMEGWKTRLVALATMALGAADFLDPATVSQALGLDSQGRAVTVIAIGALFLLLREVTKKPGSLVKK